MFKTRIGKFIVIMAIVIPVAFVAAYLYAMNGVLQDERPIVGQSLDFFSPDNRWVATEESVDNGLGFGQGMLYDEVHIRRPSEKVTEHGDKAKSAIFYIEAMDGSESRPRLRWTDSTHLIITFDEPNRPGIKPGKKVAAFRGVYITYETIAKK
jgi:hypothetical protein